MDIVITKCIWSPSKESFVSSPKSDLSTCRVLRCGIEVRLRKNACMVLSVDLDIRLTLVTKDLRMNNDHDFI